MNYYLINDDINFSKRWYLGEIALSDNWQIQKYIDTERVYEIELYQDGSVMDYTCNEAYGVSIVSGKLKNLMSDFTGVTFAKANIIGKELDDKFYIMAIPNELECINEELSEFSKFEENNPIRPDKAGEYSSFLKMVVDPEKCSNCDIFRVKGYSIAIVVSSNVKRRIEDAGILGVDFKKVSSFA